jgi:DNA-binding LacI/PurR family transcriptional regulator
MRQQGLRCPEDIAVTGFDNIPIAGFVEPALTTVQQDTKAAGITLVEHLLKHINNENTSDTLIPASLIIRDSSKPLTQD